MPTRAFLRSTGVALASGGALTILLNAAFTPFLPTSTPVSPLEASTIFLWRQGASAVAAALLLFGSVGLYLRHASRAGLFGAFAFTLAFFGSALLLAWEWTDVFVVHSLAVAAPNTLHMLDTEKGVSLYDFGALIPIVTFTLGWIALSASALRTGAASRMAAGLVIGGFFVIPLLGATVGVWGAVLGNAVLGFGFLWCGYDVGRSEPTAARQSLN